MVRGGNREENRQLRRPAEARCRPLQASGVFIFHESLGERWSQLTVDWNYEAQPLLLLFKREIIILNQSHKSSFISWVPGVTYLGRKKGRRVDPRSFEHKNLFSKNVSVKLREGTSELHRWAKSLAYNGSPRKK